MKSILRTLVRQRGFSAVVIGTLALGIGANTAIFGIVEALLLRPLPFPEPERLVSLTFPLQGIGIANAGFSYPELEDLCASGIFTEISPVWVFDTNLTGSDRPERVEGLAVSPSYFDMLGVKAAMGRVFGPEDETAGFAEGAVISEEAWRTRFGADPDILGRKLRFDNDLYTVIGVLPAGFRHPGPTLLGDIECWVAAGFHAAPFPDPPVRILRQLPRAIARLRPGLGMAKAQAKLDMLAEALRDQYPDAYPKRAGWKPQITPLIEDLTGNLRTMLLVILGSVAFVLLICTVSIVNLVLARATTRYQEFAIRRALGASTWTLTRQLVVEHLVLALLGGAAGLLVACWLQPLLLEIAPINFPRTQEIRLNLAVLSFTGLISLLTGVLTGIFPAIRCARVSLQPNLREGSKGAGVGRATSRTRNVLVGCEIAISFMLLAGSGLLLRSFRELTQVNPGFNPNNMTVAGLWLPAPNDPRTAPYPDQASRNAFMRKVLERVRRIPGVEHAAFGGGQSIPLTRYNTATFRIEGSDLRENETPSAQATAVSPDFFRSLGIRLIAGRTFEESDDGPNRFVVIDEAMAEKYWNGESPLGKRIAIGQRAQPVWFQIVGVVATIKTDAFESPDAPHLYLSIYQGSGNAMSIFLRTRDGAGVSGDLLRREVEAVDPNLPVFGIRPMDEVISKSVARRKFSLDLVSGFAIVALVLAAMGIFGVIAFSVGQRMREIGLRMALGAGKRDIILMIMRQGISITLIGVAVGILGAIGMTRFLQSLLFHTQITDPTTYIASALLLVAVSMTACYLPARRALGFDPALMLRNE